MPSAAEGIALWAQAGAQPFGLRLRTPPPCEAIPHPANRLRSFLYKAREESGAAKPTLAHLYIRTSPDRPFDELWIVNPAGSMPARLPELSELEEG